MYNDFYIDTIDLDGFKSIGSQMFSTNVTTPYLTIMKDGITFNDASFAKLENCEYIRIMLNAPKKRIVVIPTTEKDIEAISWKSGSKKNSYKKLMCPGFTSILRSAWNLRPDLRYRMPGRLVNDQNRPMILYELEGAKVFEGKKIVG